MRRFEVAEVGTPEDASTAQDAPKENWFSWLQVGGAFCLNLNTWGMMNAYGVFQTFYQLDLLAQNSSSGIAWIGSTQAFLLFLVSIVAGPIFDSGYLRLLLICGSVLLVAGAFLLSITTQYWQIFLTQAVMMGLGFGCLYLPAPAVVSQYFDANTALAMGASSAGSALGGVVFPIAFTQVQLRLGFGWATRVLAFILLLTSLIPILGMRSRATPRTKHSLVDRAAFKDTPYLLFNLGLFFGFMGLYIVLYYVQLFALDQTNVSPGLADYLLVILNASSLAGRLIPGYYADRIGSINMQMLMAAVSAVLTFSMLAIQTERAVVAFVVLYGFAAGAFMGLPAAGVVKLSTDKSKIGVRLGMTLSFVGFGVLVSNPIAGAILGGSRDWTGLISWCGALLIASCASMAASRTAKIGMRLKSFI
ncbi:major facilitator superfamily domain-containing protein [Xylariomycetidae sp. FL0641]|nr:major facilitator superfamily domain-containing protein [Xylariomycetidae sp. FL0641]